MIVKGLQFKRFHDPAILIFLANSTLVVEVAFNNFKNVKWPKSWSSRPEKVKNFTSANVTFATERFWTKSTFGITILPKGANSVFLLTRCSNIYLKWSGALLTLVKALSFAFRSLNSALFSKLEMLLVLWDDSADSVCVERCERHNVKPHPVNLVNLLCIKIAANVHLKKWAETT